MVNNKKKEANGSNGETRITNIIYKQVTLIVAIVAVVFSLITWVMAPRQAQELEIALIQKDIKTILNNDLVHMEVILNEIKEDVDSHDEQLRSIDIKLAEVLTLLKNNY